MTETIGIDIELLKRFRKKMMNSRFLDIVFTNKERNYCEKKKNPHISYAGKFCAKESVIKALGRKIPMKEIEIINNKEGKPEVRIKGRLNKNIKCSISHCEDYAIACAIISKNEK